MTANRFAGVLAAAAAFIPAVVLAQVAQFAFTTAPQTIAPGTVSGTITLQAQDSGGTSTLIPQTACLHFGSTSAQGQFSSSATNWNPVSVLTMNKSTANKNFYYKDGAEGAQTLSVQVAFKPDTESRSCASWPVEEWNVQWTVAQSIAVGAASGSGSNADSSATTSDATPQTGTSAPASGASGAVSSASVPVEPQIFAYAGKDREAIAGADTIFEGRAVDKNGDPVTPGRFLWTFGDGASAEGQTVMHHFAAPGRYAVVLDIANGLYTAAHQIVVTVLPVSIKLSVVGDRIVLANTSAKNLDLSYWSLRSNGKFFTLPKHTVVLGNASVPFTNEVTHLAPSADTALLYPNGMLAADLRMPAAPSARPSGAAPPLPPAPASESAGTAEVSAPPEGIDQVAAAALAVESGSSDGSYLWWIGAGALALAGAGAAFAARRAGKREWNIIEEGEG